MSANSTIAVPRSERASLRTPEKRREGPASLVRGKGALSFIVLRVSVTASG